MTYGSIAEFLEQGSPRLVARVMSTKSDSDTPWQRVLRSDGTCAPEVADEQVRRLRAEHVAFVSTTSATPRIDLQQAHWNPPSSTDLPPQ
jgi:methylated-DNA-protein-cysteine methyltransferase related protein